MVEIRLKNTTLSISDTPMRIQRSSDTIIPCLVKNPETVDFSTKSINCPPPLPKCHQTIQVRVDKFAFYNYS